MSTHYFPHILTIKQPYDEDATTFAIVHDGPNTAYAVEVNGIRRTMGGANRWYVFSDALHAVADAIWTRRTFDNGEGERS